MLHLTSPRLAACAYAVPCHATPRLAKSKVTSHAQPARGFGDLAHINNNSYCTGLLLACYDGQPDQDDGRWRYMVPRIGDMSR
jgi:hypothetical protein